MKQLGKFRLTSAGLHILAMAFMFCDHLWGTIINGNEWLTCVGRLAYPIFAFMIVEGYFHTSNVKRYAKRLLIAGIISEIPYNLMVASTIIFPFQQNVMWTLLMGLLLIAFIEKVDKKDKPVLTILAWMIALLIALVLGTLSMCDYGAAGVLMVLVFYMFRYKNIWSYAGQLIAMIYINTELLTGMYYPVEMFGFKFNLLRQSFAVLALIPIWLYNGEKGYSAKWFKYFCYLFYPVHMLILALIMINM